MTYIEKLTSEDTGGGIMVDVVHLKDGRCLGITEECIVLCPDFGGVFVATSDSPSISLIKPFNKVKAATSELLQALKCALADLEGSLEAHEQSNQHDWKAHKQSIKEVRLAINQATGEAS